ncbi:MAG: peptidoglycan DD-metalloendopeptidase family protein [bacterium]|nr:peptidoglycan DD-metalloendopeptidase family protein [bacterium]
MSRFKIQDSRFKNWIFILILTTYFLLPTSTIGAANPSDLQQRKEVLLEEQKKLQAEQKKLQAELEAVNKESQTLGTAVKSLDATRKKLATDINITQSKINSTSLTIKSLENTIDEKERQVVTHRRAIANTLLALSEYDARPFILDIIASTRLSDIWGDIGQLTGLNTRLEEEINTLRETRKVLGQEKEQKEKVKEEQVSLKGQLSGQKTVVEENKKAKEILLAETKNKETEYQKKLAENLARQKQFEDDLFQLESELRITLDPSLIPAARHGVLFWPLEKVFVTNLFGTNLGNKQIYASGFHNGVDFRASMGTPVKAVLAGVIEGAGNTDEMNAQFRKEGKPACVSYGRWILIKHNNGLSSVYAHLSASLVRTGQSVRMGEIIAYSGGAYGVNGSGYSFGPHLHLGLFASQGVEIRQLTNSKGGCKQIYMPIARGLEAYLDPLAYLPTL